MGTFFPVHITWALKLRSLNDAYDIIFKVRWSSMISFQNIVDKIFDLKSPLDTRNDGNFYIAMHRLGE